MGYLSHSYIIIVFLTGVSAMFRGEILVGIAGLFAPIIALIAGGTITSVRSTLGAVVLGNALLGLALYWIQASGWNVQAFGIHLSGVKWCLIGFGVGLLFGLTDARKSKKVGRQADRWRKI